MNVRLVTCPRCGGDGEEEGAFLQNVVSELFWNVQSECKLCCGRGVIEKEVK